MKLAITKGILKQPAKIVIYGAEGTGKSTLASLAPSPIVIDLEGSTGTLDVARVSPRNAVDAIQAIREIVAAHAADFKTLVIDTADWMESMLTDEMCSQQRKASIAECSGGYGKGYVELGRRFAQFLDTLDYAAAQGFNVVVLAHVKTVKVSPPDQIEGYTRFELKLNGEHVAARLKEWAHAVLFLRRDIQLVKGKDDRVKGGTDAAPHVIQTAHAPAWDAKNRHDLPEQIVYEKGKMPAELARIFAVNTPAKVAPPVAAKPVVERITDQYLDSIKSLSRREAAAQVLRKALDHYVLVDASELTMEQAKKVVQRMQAAFETPAEREKREAEMGR